VAFHHWTVETGPVLDEVAEIWDQSDADLAKNEVPTAAARLRGHLEYVAADLAQSRNAIRGSPLRLEMNPSISVARVDMCDST
jgi:hypothetical protein